MLSLFKTNPYIGIYLVTIRNSRMNSIETSKLIKGLIVNDKGSYDYLYSNYSLKLYGIALHITQRKELAEDVLQETFIKIFNKIESFSDKKGTLFTWMLNICRNGAIDKIRFGKERKQVSLDLLEIDISDDSNPEIKLANAELWGLLDKLDTDQKEILKLSYYYGYTHSEISEKRNIPFGTVKSKIRIAIRELRKLYP